MQSIKDNNGLFVGYEAEGRLRGLKTFFITGSALQHAGINVVAKISSDVHHVYIGASKSFIDSDRWDVVVNFMASLRALAVFRDILFTVEHPLERAGEVPASVLRDARLIFSLSIDSVPLVGPTTDIEIKIEDSRTALVYSNPQVIDLSYVKDRILEC